MSTEAKEETRITKLSADNYRSWKIEMKWLLRGKGLLDHVLTKIELIPNATEAQRKAHEMNENKAIAAIGLNIGMEQQVHIEECDTAYDAWCSLQQVHEPKSRVRIMRLKKQFYHLKMKQDEGMPDYLSRAKIAANNLREAGAEVSDEDIAYTLLSGLPDSYENLNMTLANLPDDKFTSKKIISTLLAEYNERIARTVDDSENTLPVLTARGIGNVNMKTWVNGKVGLVTMYDVYYVPGIRRNLMSVSSIERKGKQLTFKNGKATIWNTLTKKMICEASRVNDLYVVEAEVEVAYVKPIESHVLNLNTDELWHQRLCQTNQEVIQNMKRHNKVRGLLDTKNTKFACDACCLGKTTKAPCKRLKERQSKDVCELIYSDVCGPLPIKSIGGSRYFITFTDDYSRKTTVKCMRTKDDTIQHVKEYIRSVERQQGKKVKRFRSDNGLEYCNNQLTTFFAELGIRHERSNVETPQMNGVAERINRTLLDMTRSMLNSVSLPQDFWAEAVTTAAYIKNRITHSSINHDVPLAVWTRKIPSIHHLRVFGCLAYARLPKQGAHKLDNRGVECILVGYGTHTQGYRLWCPQKQDVVTTKHVKFVEHKVGYEWINKTNVYGWSHNEAWSDGEDARALDANADVGEQTEISNVLQYADQDATTQIVGARDSAQTSIRGKSKKNVRNPYGRKGKPKETKHEDYSDSEDTIKSFNIEANMLEISEPQTLEEALSSPQAAQWQSAMREEIDTLENRKTWEIVDLLEGQKCIGSRWVYKVKSNAEGNISRYKARLVAQGHTQRKGIDYTETYSPVASFAIIRLLLAMTAVYGWYIRHIDITCAYLYGKLDETIYMRLPSSFGVRSEKIARLLRPIYGLKQSGRKWNEELNDFLIKEGFKRMKSSSCTYTSHDSRTIVVIYVDDLLIFLQEKSAIDKMVDEIGRTYESSDLGEMSHVLGVKIERKTNGDITLSQKAYTESLLKRYNMTEYRPAATPLESEVTLSTNDSPTSDQEKADMARVPYREIIGSLMFLALYTRPDILYAVTKLSQFNANPGKVHWGQAKHILRYLTKTKEYELMYKRCEEKPKINIYSDADWAGDIDQRRSCSGMVMNLDKNVIQWRTTKQKNIALSTMEAEYIALSQTMKQVNAWHIAII